MKYYQHYPFSFPSAFSQFYPHIKKKKKVTGAFEEEKSVLAMSFPISHWLSSFFCVLMDFLKWLKSYWPCIKPQIVSHIHTFVKALCAFSSTEAGIPSQFQNQLWLYILTVQLMPSNILLRNFIFYNNHMRATIER